MYLISLVTKEVNFTVLLFYVLQAVGFVPTLREDVKADLPTYGVGQAQVTKLVFQCYNEFFPAFEHGQGTARPDLLAAFSAIPDASLQVKLLKFISLCLAAVAANRGYIQHATSELNKGSPLDWNVKVCYVV